MNDRDRSQVVSVIVSSTQHNTTQHNTIKYNERKTPQYNRRERPFITSINTTSIGSLENFAENSIRLSIIVIRDNYKTKQKTQCRAG
jgi:hypothetical protein